MIRMDNLGLDFSDFLTVFFCFFYFFYLGENQTLFHILLIKVNRDMFFSPFNKIYFHNPPKQFFI